MGLVAEGGEPLKVTGATVSDNLFRTLGAPPRSAARLSPAKASPGETASPSCRTRSGAGASPRIRTSWVAPFSSISSRTSSSGSWHRASSSFSRGRTSGLHFLGVRLAANFKATFSQAVARLEPGVSIALATQELRRSRPTCARPGTGNDWGRTISVAALHETVTGNVRPTLLILLGAVGLILLLASVNLGTLVLGRSIERVAEMAVERRSAPRALD